MSFTVISVSENLPRFAARRVSEGGGRDFSNWTVVFPTARLGQHFRRELASRTGACLPPRVLTLSSLMERLAPGGGGRPLSPLERILILRSLLSEGEFRHLGPGMEGLISSFWEELVQAGHPPDRAETFELMETAFRENPLGSESYAAYWIEFSGELARLSASYRERLEEMGLREPSWGREEFLPPEGKILICGFYDATPLQVGFLKKLGGAAEFIYQAEKSPAFTAVVNFARELGHDIGKKLPEPTPALLQAADAFLISSLPPEEAERISLYSLPSLAAEARSARYEALKARARGERVLVVVPHRPEYIAIFSAVFALPLTAGGEDLEVSNALSRSCSEDRAVQLLEAVLSLAGSGLGSYHLVRFLEVAGARRLLGEVSEETVHRLKSFLSEHFCQDYQQLKSYLMGGASSREEETRELLGLAGSIRALVRPLREEVGFGEKVRRLLEIFDRCRSLFPPSDLDLAARARVRAGFQEMIEADKSLRLRLSGAEFASLLEETIFSAGLHLTPEPFRGIQLVHILESRAVPAETVILTGMNEGEFPSSLPHHLVEDLLARKKLGLITPERLESLEELNFFSLILSPRRVILTRCPHSLREDAAESRFLTRLRLAGEEYRDPVPVATTADYRYRRYRDGETISPLPEIAPASGFFPSGLSEVIPLSATSTEMLLNCPVRFFFHLLGLDAPPAVREDLDPRSQGILLHSLAAACWELPPGEDGASLEERLIELGGREIPAGPAFTELRLRLECGGWKRFARRVTELLADWTPREWEERVSESLPWGKRRLRLHGRIDFIGTGEGGRIVVDFKRSSLPHKVDIKKLNKPQLPFYSLCLRLRDLPVSHLGYCSFLTAKKGYLELKEDGLTEQLIARIKAELSRAEEGGGYSCRPDEKYCRYCPYRGVCRFEDLRAREKS